MAVALTKLVEYIDQFLEVDRITDYCPNGLQIEGTDKVQRIVGGVTASQALIDKAIEMKADAVLVHHGYFWKGEPEAIRGIKKNRIKSFLENDISLLAYHLPLDVHKEVGNNVQLAQYLDLNVIGKLEPSNPKSVGIATELDREMTASEFSDFVSRKLNRECFHIGANQKLIKSVGVCTGAAQGMIEHAVNLGLDAYLSGEVSEPTVHIARESGVNYFSAGHHATERGGVKALGHHLSSVFDIEFDFVDIDNPV